MYLKAFNKTAAVSNGITAGESGFVADGFSVLQTGQNANIEEINFLGGSGNPFGTATSITAITPAIYPNPGESIYEQAFVNATPNLPLRVELIRPLSSDATNYGFLFNRGEGGLSSNGRQTIANLGALVTKDDVALTTGLATPGTIFRLIDIDGRPVTSKMTVSSTISGGSFAWVRIANIANATEIETYFLDPSYYTVQSDDDVAEPSGNQLRVEVFTNSKATLGNGIWELYSENGTLLASN